jgi:hypothetical protein
MTAADIADALHGRRSGAGWVARCPAHKDKTPSLSIRESDSRILVHCFSGCTQRDVVIALRERGLWPERPRPTWTASERREYGRRRSQAETLARRALDWRAAIVARLQKAKAAALHRYVDCPNESSERAWAEASRQLFQHETLRGPALRREYSRAVQLDPASVRRHIAETIEDRADAERCATLAVTVLSLAAGGVR